MTNIDIKQVLKDWINANKGDPSITVIEANQNAPRPELPYITLLVTSVTVEEHANISSPNSDGDASIENEAAVMCSLQCFADDAFSILSGLKLSLEKVTVKQNLRAVGLPYIRTLSEVSDISEVVGTNFETRASLDLEFRTTLSVIDNIGVIESVYGTGINGVPWQVPEDVPVIPIGALTENGEYLTENGEYLTE